MRNKEQNARKKVRWRANRRYKKLIALTERKMTEPAGRSVLVSQTERELALEIQADEDARIFADILAAQGRP